MGGEEGEGAEGGDGVKAEEERGRRKSGRERKGNAIVDERGFG